MFDWNDLRYLRALSTAGTFAGAARELGVKHTTVARRIAALESDLGVALVRKGGEQITLTDAGLAVLVHAHEMKSVSDAIERGVATHLHANVVEGLVRVTLPDTLAGYFVMQLADLRARHPRLTVNVLADQRVYDLLAGEADLAVRIADDARPELVERRLGVVAWALYAAKSYVASRGHPRAVADFASHDLLGYDGAALSASPGAAWFREHLPDARFVMRGNNLLQIFNATILGTGVTLLPCFMAEREPTLVRLAAESFHNRTIRLLFPADLKRVPRMRAVIDFLIEIFGRDAALFGGVPAGSSDAP